jgi:hypothetical protein
MIETMTDTEYFIVMAIVLFVSYFAYEYIGGGLIRLWKNRKNGSKSPTNLRRGDMDNRVTIWKPQKDADESKRKANKLFPGDIVRITQNATDSWGRNPIVAVAGSTAVVLSLEEYATYIGNYPIGYRDAHLKIVKEWIEAGYQYPFRFLTVPHDEEDCFVGAVTCLHELFFEVIERKTKSDMEGKR